MPPESHRLFLGIPIPPSVATPLEIWQQEQPRLPGIKWVQPTQWHLTVYFFGAVAGEMLDNLQSLIHLALRDQSAFELAFQGYQTAPPRQEARMLWARYQRHPEFEGMARKLRTLYQQIQPDLPTRYKPIPHLTLARLKTPQLAEQIAWPKQALAAIRVRELVLWESHLQADGPEYQVMRRYQLWHR